MIRTRFAPSPTGFLHIGGVRTALFSWAYAKKMQGHFILRIEDTDLERSTPESVKAILDGMKWIGLTYDEGPFYQTERFDRYKEAIQQLLDNGLAYYCYCSKTELDEMRKNAELNGEHFVYDRRWRPEPGKTLPPIPENQQPVVRFKMPIEGQTEWQDLVKGHLAFNNKELDDLIIARSDGTPTYNFCVVIDDYDMQISHVIRGDDHVNNTPKQINILKALNAKIPNYAHLPMILNESGTKMSKRRDAVSVVDYAKLGILPEALLNYLARLGWSHGNDELFSITQFIDWFDFAEVNPSPSRFDMEKLKWLNAEYIKQTSPSKLAELITPNLKAEGYQFTQDFLEKVLLLVRDRVNNLNDLASETHYFFKKLEPSSQEIAKFWDVDAPARLERFKEILIGLGDNQWHAEDIHALFKPFCEAEGIKMGKLGMPLRLKVCGTSKTPSIDLVLELLGKEEVLKRLN